MKTKRKIGFKENGFSLVEVLAAVAIIGIITFLAIPNIVAVKQDSETNMAISRAEALNIAMVSYVQANGHENASDYWSQQVSIQGRYALLASYLAFETKKERLLRQATNLLVFFIRTDNQ